MKKLFDLEKPNFSFLYGGIPFSEHIKTAKKEVIQNQNKYEIIYILADGLKITQYLDIYDNYNALRWVIYFENTSSEDSQIMSNICDCDMTFSFNEEYIPTVPGYVPSSDIAKVYRTIGSNWVRDEYSSYGEVIIPGRNLSYSCTGGRSAQGLAPYFDINQGDKGVICAIGWTGQWKASFQGVDKGVTLNTGIESLSFKILPNERLRTSSVIILNYDNNQNEGHILFKRLIKNHFSSIGMPGRPQNGPLCISAWGALDSDIMVNRIEKFKNYNLGAECYWVDAGWYGYSTDACPNEHVGDWGSHTGSWNINPTYHPDGFLEVSKALKNANMDFLLWFEPERVIKTTKTPTEHPEWFFKINDTDSTWLLNLGNEDALSGTVDMISEKIECLGLSCYRQDFNMDPLNYWRTNDEPDRNGINEIKHIMGLYRLWDTLLEKFPHLYIDNCASGGRRNDIEMISRSIPLWRSDYQCWFDADPETAQIHNTGISWWLPYSGTGVGSIMGDKYRTRSCYSAAMTVECWMYETWDIDDSQPIDKIKELFSEYKQVRPFFSCDFYPLIKNSYDDTCWTAWQYNRPEEKDGIIMAFRRPESPLSTAELNLSGLSPNKIYQFIDADTNETFIYNYDDLQENKFKIVINEKRSSKLYFYKQVE